MSTEVEEIYLVTSVAGSYGYSHAQMKETVYTDALTVELESNRGRIEIQNWSGPPPLIGDRFKVTVEAVEPEPELESHDVFVDACLLAPPHGTIYATCNTCSWSKSYTGKKALQKAEGAAEEHRAETRGWNR